MVKIPKSKQQGVSLISMLFVGGVLIFLGVAGAPVIPIYVQ
jgi:Tfp pilus assembly protein PilX